MATWETDEVFMRAAALAWPDDWRLAVTDGDPYCTKRQNARSKMARRHEGFRTFDKALLNIDRFVRQSDRLRASVEALKSDLEKARVP